MIAAAAAIAGFAFFIVGLIVLVGFVISFVRKLSKQRNR